MQCVICAGSLAEEARVCPHCSVPYRPNGRPARRGVVVAETGTFAPSAGLPRRAPAHVIDNALIWLLGVWLGAMTRMSLLILLAPRVRLTYDQAHTLLHGTYYVSLALIWFGYHWWGDACGRSLGKRLMGIHVVRRRDGAAPGRDRGLERTLGRLLSVGAYGLGFL